MHSFLSVLYIKKSVLWSHQKPDAEIRRPWTGSEAIEKFLLSHITWMKWDYFWYDEMCFFTVSWKESVIMQTIFTVIYSTPNFAFASCPFDPTPISTLSTCLDTFGFWIGAYQMSSWMRKVCREIHSLHNSTHAWIISRHSITCINIGNAAITLKRLIK